MSAVPNPTPQNKSQRTNSGTLFHWVNLWTDPDVEVAFGESWTAIKQYLALTANTESPRQYHLWNLLFLASSITASNAWIDHGKLGRIKLNMGVVLTGRPTIRKSSAISFMRKIGTEFSLNFGPTDVGGARHGIMAAMQSRYQREAELDLAVPVPQTLSELAEADYGQIFPYHKTNNKSSHIVFAVNELGRLLTAQTRELLDFFKDGLDNESIYYQTKTGSIRITDPMISIMSTMTPSDLRQILPREQSDHSLLSRLIFVYASRQAPNVPLPTADTLEDNYLYMMLLDRLRKASKTAFGPIALHPEAIPEYLKLYNHNIPTVEFRMTPYSGIRSIHLLKTAAAICILRAEEPYQIKLTDLKLAHLILLLTEIEMEGAFTGLDRSIDGKIGTYVRDFLETEQKSDAPIPIPASIVQKVIQRLGFSEDEATKGIQRLIHSGRIVLQPGGGLTIRESVSAEKARFYFNHCMPVDEQSRLV